MGALGATLEAAKRASSGRGSRGPPSRERETWILVSLVLRFMRAVRRGDGVDIMGLEGGVENLYFSGWKATSSSVEETWSCYLSDSMHSDGKRSEKIAHR